MTVFAGAVIQAEDGRVLCQLRDDKPGIIYPGYWTCTPGGHVGDGESPREAIIRELFEEFEIRVTKLKTLATFTETTVDGIEGMYHAFSARLATAIEAVKCNEGVKVAFVTLQEAMNLKQPPVSLRILDEYVKQINAEPASGRMSGRA